ncbi:cell division protein FtsZ [Thermodesulfatator indicus DSM 15286]|uniref:Cell division protein FtsZ n=1 Tax=Thermodesulfatator indicus (strain DSM 15286 / JCM 11887 / CIR29812) TaxID=667014 RepID=F8AAN9_THEID|nr:cell division protein FtsZ [Thermodesulfatator indicus]AEH44311.1 cell division protein FtsZ [Thermodesulfatator indicus DSM 15286]
MSFEILESEYQAKIKVIGVGGAGGNAVNNMISKGLRGVEFIVANTDYRVLDLSPAPVKIQLGKELTKGLGAGGNPEVGKEAAIEAENEIREALSGADMVFITAGLGGGTGTGAAPIVARISKELGALTIAVVTKPFSFEGKPRAKIAQKGFEELKREVDTIITIPNDRLRALASPKAKLLDMFRQADDVLYYAVRGISDLILFPGYVNLDFADVRAVMSEMGMALMGTGVASGENRAEEAAQKAISSPLLDDVSISGAKGVLLNITASAESLTMEETEFISELVSKEAHEEAKIFWGVVFDEQAGDEMRVTVVATGIGAEEEAAEPLAEVVNLDVDGMRREVTPEKPEPKLAKLSERRRKKRILEKLPSEEELEVPAFLRRKAD